MGKTNFEKQYSLRTRLVKSSAVMTGAMLEMGFIYAPAFGFLARHWLISTVLLMGLIIACFNLSRYRTYRAEIQGYSFLLISVNLVAIVSLALDPVFSMARLFGALLIFGIGMAVGVSVLRDIANTRARNAFGKWPPN